MAEVDISQLLSEQITAWEEGGKEGPKPGSERWTEIYYEAQESKRTKAELAREREERKKDKDLIVEMGKWNKNLTEAVEGFKEVIVEKEGDKVEDGLNAKLEKLKADKKVAREKADFDAETAIDDEIVEVKLQLRDHKATKAEVKKTKVEVKEKGSESNGDLSDEDKEVYKQWMNDTPWFSKNARMRSMAMKTEEEVWKDPDFADASIEEVLEEVKIRVEEKFQYKPKGSDNGNVDLVETGGRRSGRGISVKLSPQEIELAKGFGHSIEDVAKQKALIEAHRGKQRRGGA